MLIERTQGETFSARLQTHFRPWSSIIGGTVRTKRFILLYRTLWLESKRGRALTDHGHRYPPVVAENAAMLILVCTRDGPDVQNIKRKWTQRVSSHALRRNKRQWVTLWGRGGTQRKRNGSRFGAGAVNNERKMGHALGQGQWSMKEKWVTLWGRESEQRKINGSRFGAGTVNNEREMGHALGQGVHNEREMGHALGHDQWLITT